VYHCKWNIIKNTEARVSMGGMVLHNNDQFNSNFKIINDLDCSGQVYMER
jgi:hypothetical protein